MERVNETSPDRGRLRSRKEGRISLYAADVWPVHADRRGRVRAVEAARRATAPVRGRSEGIAAVTHQKLADDIGSVLEVVSRLLGRWTEAGLIELRRGAIQIGDRTSLAAAGRH
ncbi:helix-turn-helix domain-containing protein [Methylobacterium oryzae]|uniref:helix-turn-helix domain-containing protein n=1 Tax=Methylobacterium oryzae TaxID=334852 RepID=UPI002F35CF4C